MELLLCVVEANAAAKSLASISAECLHLVEDCSALAETCNKVLPAALSVVEGADYVATGLSRSQAVECVQGLTNIMVQLRDALKVLGEHESEGVLGVLLEHPAAWLEAYRGFRCLTAQLVGLSCIVRAAAQRRCVEDAEERLKASVKSLMSICGRARDAATLIGTDLPDFAKSAVNSGWTCPARLAALRCPGAKKHHALSHVLPHESALASARTSLGDSSCETALSTPARALEPPSSPAKRSGGLFKRIGGGGRAAAAAASASAGMTPSAASSPGTSSPQNTTRSASFTSAVPAHPSRSLEETACALVCRVQTTILYDSEVEHLEQDRTYLVHRVKNLREHVAAVTMSVAGDGAAGVKEALSAAAAAAAASLVQSEVLLAAVDARLAALSSGGGACALCGGAEAAAEGGKGDGRRTSGSEVEYDASRRRRGGMRWLPMCFVGA